MSLSLWMLLGFAGWTLLILIVGVGAPRWTLILLGRADLTSFPGDTPHGSASYRRAVRAHANCLETLPVFAAVVLVATITHLAVRPMDVLAATTMGARIVQTSVHVLFRERPRTIAVRFSFFLVQVVAIIAMGLMLAIAAAGA
jgi:uncharacterized MAPEG superfamily protein